MWKKYFGNSLHLYGIDINPKCKELESENIKIFIGEQEDRDFWKKIKTQFSLTVGYSDPSCKKTKNICIPHRFLYASTDACTNICGYFFKTRYPGEECVFVRDD